MTLPAWPWLLATLSAALAIHGGWRAFRAQTAAQIAAAPAAPRPGIMEFGVGMAGIAMLLPRLAGVYIP